MHVDVFLSVHYCCHISIQRILYGNKVLVVLSKGCISTWSLKVTPLPYPSGEQVEATVSVETRVVCRRVQGLGDRQEQPVDEEQEEVEKQKRPEEEEVGQHWCPKTPTQLLERRLPQPKGAQEGQTTEEKTPCLFGEPRGDTRTTHD